MGYCNNENFFLLNSVDDTVRKSAEQVAPRAMLICRPRFGMLLDGIERCIDFRGECDRGRRTPLGVPTGRGFGFNECFFEELKCEGFHWWLRGYDDVPRPTE